MKRVISSHQKLGEGHGKLEVTDSVNALITDDGLPRQGVSKLLLLQALQFLVFCYIVALRKKHILLTLYFPASLN